MLFLPKELEAAEALSRLLQIGVALALWRACQTLSLTSGSPFPCSIKERPQDIPAGLLAWKTNGPRSKADYCWRPFPAQIIGFHRRITLRFPEASSQAPERGWTRKSNLVWGGKRLFSVLFQSPTGARKALLNELRNQDQGPSPGPRRSHRAQAKVQGQLPGILPSNILLTTNRKRKAGQGQSWDPPLEVGSGGCWQLPNLQGSFSKVLLGGGGKWGGGKRSPQVCVSSMRSDTWWRLPVLPGFAREGGAHGSQAEPGGAGDVVGGRTRGEVVCCFASRSSSCGELGKRPLKNKWPSSQ